MRATVYADRRGSLIASGCAAIWREVVSQVALVICYWLTNVLGLVLMHRGARQFRQDATPAEARRELVKDLWIAVGYTALICGLLKLGVLKPIENYFPYH